MSYVGGILFYIDSSADGTYTFYNAQGAQVAAPTVGTDCTGWTYEVTDATKDKYYVLGTGENLRGKSDQGRIVWSLGNEDFTPFSDIVEQGYITQVGGGRNNSDWIKENRFNSTYYPKTHNAQACDPYTSSYFDVISIWELRDIANNANANGCNDWYCPSVAELNILIDGGVEWRNNVGWRRSYQLMTGLDEFDYALFYSSTPARLTNYYTHTEYNGFYNGYFNLTDDPAEDDAACYYRSEQGVNYSSGTDWVFFVLIRSF